MGAKYTAADVAACVVTSAFECGRPVSNLQLQKILYFIQRDYMLSHGGITIFDDEFEAWQYGPVIPSVYWTYSIFGGSPIKVAQKYKSVDFLGGCDEPLNRLLPADEEFVRSKAESMSRLPAWKLVDESHRKGGAWDAVYSCGGPGMGNRNVIPAKLIMDRDGV